MITDVAGVTVGHWTDAEVGTGTTVVRFPEGTVASGEVRGGAPATREFALLEPTRMVSRVDAVVLTGGSAFGLAAADGVMGELAAADVGFETVGGRVPIVVAMALFDLVADDGTAKPLNRRPGPAAGIAACRAAIEGPHDVGRVGAGAGATVAKWQGIEHRRPGGIVAATRRGPDGLVVSTLIACNAFGEPGADAGTVAEVRAADAFVNTTIGVVATNAALDKVGCHLVAQSAHHGLARAVAPSHTQVDGDAFVAAATGAVDCGERVTLPTVRALTTAVVVDALAALASG